MIAPCKGCSDRQVGCHSNCTAYLSYLKEHSKEKEVLDRDKTKRGLYRDFKSYSVEHTRRSHH